MNLITSNPVTFVEQHSFPDGQLAGAAVAPLIQDLLAALGEDTQRPGLLRTPERVARMYGELLSGMTADPAALINDAIFDSDYQGMVLVRDVEFYSLCEHHLLPFFGHAHVAYLAGGKVLGLSKIPRVVDMYARRLQIQEQMTQQIAEFLWDLLRPRGVAVVVEAAHMCAMMRGVKKTGTRMATSTMLGAFETDPGLRQELLAQIGRPAAAYSQSLD